MQNCPSCGALLAERALFCASCAIQVRCKECRELLEKDARACIMCGSAVGAGTASPIVSGNIAQMNTLELQEDLRSRSLRISFTDTAIGSLGETVNRLLSDKLTRQGRQALKTGEGGPTQLPLLPGADGDGGDQTAADVKPPEEAKPSIEVPSDLNRILQIFEPNGNDFKLEENRLKADSLQEYARRLTYLFLYAHELHGRKPILYANVKKILESSRVWDSNTRHALGNKMAVEIENDMIRLKRGGREKAIQVLNEILDPNYHDPGWTPESQSRTSKSGSDAKETRSIGRVGRKRSNQAEEWAEKWEKHPDQVDGHFILKDKTILEKAVLALWAIHKIGGKTASSLYIQRFVTTAFSLTISPKSMDKALRRKNGFVIKSDTDKGYKLTPSGARHAEQMVKAAK